MLTVAGSRVGEEDEHGRGLHEDCHFTHPHYKNCCQVAEDKNEKKKIKRSSRSFSKAEDTSPSVGANRLYGTKRGLPRILTIQPQMLLELQVIG